VTTVPSAVTTSPLSTFTRRGRAEPSRQHDEDRAPPRIRTRAGPMPSRPVSRGALVVPIQRHRSRISARAPGRRPQQSGTRRRGWVCDCPRPPPGPGSAT
jgi:hypothetical protein